MATWSDIFLCSCPTAPSVTAQTTPRGLIGYARVSADEQNLDLQLDALRAACCERIFQDTGSGSLKHRPQLDACVDYLRAGDALIVRRLDRLGRGLKHLIEAIDQLHERRVGFRSLAEAIDTTTSAGWLQFHIFGALAESEREIIRERTRADLAAARARGRIGGRPPTLTPEKLAAVRAMQAQDDLTMDEIARGFGVSRTTLYRHLAATDELDASNANQQHAEGVDLSTGLVSGARPR